MENLYLIAGLGNPGSEYARTRHNAGFMVVEKLAERWKAPWKAESKFRARLARGEAAGRKTWLCKPETFMNLSGEAVVAVAEFYKIAREQLMIVVDDADLCLGEIRLRAGGSSGGHHGLESVERHLGTREYARQRIGIGRNESGGREITGHVLGCFTSEEGKVFEKVLERAADQLECWLAEGIQQAMNRFNGAVAAPLAKDIE